MNNEQNRAKPKSLKSIPTYGYFSRITTLLLSSFGFLILSPTLLGLLLHTRADSEVGMMVHGMVLLQTLMHLSFVVLPLSLSWAFGIFRRRALGFPVPWWDWGLCITHVALFALVMCTVSIPYLRSA